MNIFEVIKKDGTSEFLTGSTHYHVALAMSRENKVFESVLVRHLEHDKEVLIDGALLFSLAYLDNHYGEADEAWELKED